MGFSLVEVLVVMGLIAVLSAALIVVLPRVSNAAKVAATRATIKKVDELLNDRMNAFKRYILTQDRLAGAGIPSYVIQQGTISQAGGSVALAKILAIKQLFRQSFPQSFAASEMVNPPTYTSTHNKNTESAACLYIILTQQAVFDTEPPSAADLRGVEVADTDKDGVPEIVDAWGQPLRFYRWPTRLIRVATTPTTPQSITTATYGIQINPQWTVTCTSTPPQTSTVTTQALISTVSVPTPGTLTLLQEQNTASVQNLAKDPDDPSGLIQTAMTQTAPPALFTPQNFESLYHTPDTYFTPLILSAGPAEQGADGDLLGLYEPWDTTNFGNLAQPVINTTNTQALTAIFAYITNQQR
jgi:prepilin-type N-terminal cleavage/methylation domain-containing protein